MLKIVEKQDGFTSTIALEGELLAISLDELRIKIKKIIDSGTTTAIIFDMSKIDSVDSAGIGLIAAAHNSLTKINGSLKLIGLSKDMYQFFVCLRMNTHFTMETKEE
jgi:anti-anti-sigma factor